MKLLALDTTTEYIVLSLYLDGKTDYFISEKGSKKHNSTLLNHIDWLLTINGVTLEDIDVFGVAVGPGSFTGIRVGVATVNAFSVALGKKLVEVTTLELAKQDDCLVMLDCGHGNYYTAKYTGDEVEYAVLTMEEADKIDLPKIFVSGTYEHELLDTCVKKAENGEFTTQTKPFYLRKSSAERETGIEC